MSKRLIGGKDTPSYEKRYKELRANDLMVLYVSKNKTIRGYCSITGKYFYEKTKVWPVINGERYPHRRRIEIIKVFKPNKEPRIEDFYDELQILEKARKEKRNLGVTFASLIQGTTPIEISQNDYNLLTGKKPALISETDFRKKEAEKRERSKKLSLDELRKRIAKSNHKVKTTKVVSDQYVRNQDVAIFVKRHANGICQLCNKPAPFLDKNQDPFLEEHHITWLSKKGEDTPENAVALCPNCHRKMHILNSAKDRQILRQKAKLIAESKK